MGHRLLADNTSLKEEADALASILTDAQLEEASLADRRAIVLSNPARRLIETELRQLVAQVQHKKAQAQAQIHHDEDRDPTSVATTSFSAHSRPSSRGTATPPTAPGLPGPLSSRPSTGPRPLSSRPSTGRPFSSRPSTSASGGFQAGLIDLAKGLGAVGVSREGKVDTSIQMALQDLFVSEGEALRDDIEWLQQVMDAQLSQTLQARAPAMSIQDMKAESAELRAELANLDRQAALARLPSLGGNKGGERPLGGVKGLGPPPPARPPRDTRHDNHRTDTRNDPAGPSETHPTHPTRPPGGPSPPAPRRPPSSRPTSASQRAAAVDEPEGASKVRGRLRAMVDDARG